MRASDVLQSPVRVGLIGAGIAGSRTPAMHMAEAAAQGFTLDYRLLDTDGMPTSLDLVALLDRLAAEGYAGVNVTHPYKQAVLAHLGGVSEAAERVGAVNTVLFRGTGPEGHNTDFSGFAEALRDGLPDAEKDAVLLLGAGGAGGAVAFALLAQGVRRLMVHDRDRGAAARLAARVNAAGAGQAEAVDDAGDAMRCAQGIVNATPMGMARYPGTAIDTALLDRRHWVADIVYLPLETALLRAARARGCRTLSGAGMAVHQAAQAFALFTGRQADAARMTATFEAMG